MSNYYPETSASPDFPALEKEQLAYWQQDDTFRASVAERPKDNEYVFYDGPPFANGLPHYGHLLTSYVKDIYARYHTMKGERVERRFGWDCHGLPAEMAAEKELGVSGRSAIEEYGIQKFNDHCRTSVMKYTHEWERYINRAARWVDFENDYKTMDTNYMESVIWAFKQLYDKGLVYESFRVMPYSWAAQTPLSNFETRMDDAYREREDKAVTVAFKLIEPPSLVRHFYEHAKLPVEGYYILAWTTTLWTLPSNLALAVSPTLNYRAYLHEGKVYILATYAYKDVPVDKAQEHVARDDWEGEFNEEQSGVTFTGSELVGLSYQPLFPYFSAHKHAFKVLSGDFIEEGSGTGIVHMAPGFGEDDQRVCEANGISLVCPVDDAGQYTEELFDIPSLRGAIGDAAIHTGGEDGSPRYARDDVFSLKGLNVIADKRKAADEPYTDSQLEKYGLANLRIITWLKANGSLFKQEEYKHSYPHCWRTDTPLIYRAISSWYVEVTKFKDRMVELNQNINWIPEHIKDGQFGKWLENARDWSISRNRYWGCPIPVWKSDKGNIRAFGSIAELEAFFGVQVHDLHRPEIDNLTKTENGETWTRVTDVFDCWFESGSMPYAQVHYPFENKEWFENHFPADFIVEYVGQTRGWFYTLMVLSTALFDREPFENCICHGIILAEDGKKLSKRLKNYPDPNDMFIAYGADAVRWRMIKEPVMQGGNLLIAQDGGDIRDVVRLSLKPIWNAYHFFSLYANADGVRAYNLIELAEEDDNPTGSLCCGGSHGIHAHGQKLNVLDRYILAKLRGAVKQVETALDAYDSPTACKAVDAFFETLTNWYIRRSRDRFWSAKQEGGQDKQDAYDTLYTVLFTMSKTIAPLLPLMSEAIYRGLTNERSVHLASFPNVDSLPVEAELVQQMDWVREVCAAGLAIRDKETIRTRQPLASLTIYGEHIEGLGLFVPLLQDELNVKNVVLSTELAKAAERKLQVNLPVVGKRLGAKLGQVMGALKKGDWKQEGDNVLIAGERLALGEYSMLLVAKQAKGAQATDSQNILVVLDTTLTPELIAEGYSRDVIRIIQQARKDAGLNVADRIVLHIACDDGLAKAIEIHQQGICDATLATEMFNNATPLSHSSSGEIEGMKITVSLQRAKVQDAA